MTEEQLNENIIRNKIQGICQDCIYLDKIVPILNKMLKETYIDGLEQGKLDMKMDTMYDNTKKSRLTNTTKEFHLAIDKNGAGHIVDENNQYYQVDYTNEVTRLNVEKQQLISWLEDKIKDITNYAISFGLTIDKDISHEIDIKKSIYQEVLDFVNKGGKDE